MEMLGSFWRHRSLIKTLRQREVLGRYRGSMLGILWSFFTPLVMLTVYTFVFSVVFKARWGTGEGQSKVEFALLLFAGLLIFNMFAECIGRAPQLILGNVNYVKKVVFPLEVLAWVSLAGALFHLVISLVVWLLVHGLFIGAPPLTFLWAPMILLPFALFVLGLSWYLSSLSVYLRDIAQFIGPLVTMLMFLSPIFYPASALPEAFQQLFYLNPFTPALESMRDVLYQGNSPNLIYLAGYTLAALAFAWSGFVCFQKTRKGFADVL